MQSRIPSSHIPVVGGVSLQHIVQSPLLSSRSESVIVTVATTLEEVAELRSIWNSFPIAEVDTDIDYFMAIVANHQQAAQPYVIHIRRGLDPDLLVVARRQTITMPLRLGYCVFGWIRMCALVVAFDGILGSNCREDEDLVFRLLRKILKENEADVIVMGNVDVHSHRYAAARASTPLLLRGRGLSASRRWVAKIPNTFEKFLEGRSSKTRKRLRWEDRALHKAFSDRLRLRVFSRLEDREELCRDMQAVASLSYQDGLGVAFSGTDLELAVMWLGLSKGWHRTWILYLNDQPVSFWTGLAYGNTFFVGTPGFDPNFAKHSVGRFTMLRMVEDLCADPSISRLDFGRGEAEYKSSFGEDVRLEREIFLTAARPSVVVWIWIHSVFSAANNLAREISVKSSWVRRLKMSWRRSMASALKKPPIS